MIINESEALYSTLFYFVVCNEAEVQLFFNITVVWNGDKLMLFLIDTHCIK